MIERDPRERPKSGDVLKSSRDDRMIHVDFIKYGYVYYRVSLSGEIINCYRCQLATFKQLALEQCLPPGGEN